MKEIGTNSKIAPLSWEWSLMLLSKQPLTVRWLINCMPQNELFSITLCFQVTRFVSSADIKQMCQIWINYEDRKFQLIFLRSNPSEPIKCYQLCIATKCLQCLATEGRTKYPERITISAPDFYVHDALDAQTQLSLMLQEAGFKLMRQRSKIFEKYSSRGPGISNKCR